MSAEVNGVIHDIGYQRYDGPRLGRLYAARSLYSHGVRAAFGIGRSAKAKVFPWIVVGLLTLVAAVLTVVTTQTPGADMPYVEFAEEMSLLLVLFCAVVGPELVSRDLRTGILPLYFSRPLTRTDYPLAKLAALVSAFWLILAGPQLLMFLGAAFSVDRLSEVWPELRDLGEGLAASGVYALTFSALALLVASLAGRRAVAAAIIVAAFLITTPVFGVLLAVAGEDSQAGQLAGLVSPMTLVMGVSQWWFDPEPDIGAYGPVYGLTTLGLVAACVLLLLLRYRKVAR